MDRATAGPDDGGYDASDVRSSRCRRRRVCGSRGAFVEGDPPAEAPAAADVEHETADYGKVISSFSAGRFIPFSKFSSQILAHGRLYISGTLNGIVRPATTGVALPSIG